MTAPVPKLRMPDQDVPRAVEEVVQRLLRKDPRDRYQSADGVLADLQAILAAFDRGEHDPLLVVGSADLRTSLTEPALVGRGQELERIDESIAQVEAALREAISVGADEAILFSDRAFAGADTWSTSLTLATALAIDRSVRLCGVLLGRRRALPALRRARRLF